MEKIHRNVVLDVDKVNLLLDSKNISKREMSLGMGLSKSYISNCLGPNAKGGPGRMNAAYAQLLAVKLGVELDDILAPEKVEVKEPAEETTVTTPEQLQYITIQADSPEMIKKIDQLGKAIMMQNDILMKLVDAWNGTKGDK